MNSKKKQKFPEGSDEAWLEDLHKNYLQGIYLEVNFLEFCERCGGMDKALVWACTVGMKFVFKPHYFYFGPKDEKKPSRKSADYDTIVFSKNRKFLPKNYINPDLITYVK